MHTPIFAAQRWYCLEFPEYGDESEFVLITTYDGKLYATYGSWYDCEFRPSEITQEYFELIVEDWKYHECDPNDIIDKDRLVHK